MSLSAADVTSAPSSASPPTRAPDAERIEASRLVHAGYRLLLAGALLLFAAKLVARFEGSVVWDDAWMFQRYAHNLLSEGRIVWNPLGEPTYGLTSPLMLALAAPLQWLAGKHLGLAALLGSTLPGVVFLVLSFVLITRRVDAPPWAKRALSALVAYGFATSLLVDHFVSGMDTMLALAFLSFYLLLAGRAEQEQDHRNAVVLGLVGGLAFGIRPELCSFTLLVPISFLVARAPLRRVGATALAITAAMLAAHLVVNWLYFETPVPLPFYAKSTNLYGRGFLAAYRGTSTAEIVNFLNGHWPLVALAALDVVVHPRAVAAAPLDRAVLVSAVACLGYSWAAALQIMGGAGRFYYPTLAAFVLLAGRGVGRIVHSLGSSAVRPKARDMLAGVLAIALLAWTMTPLLLTASKDVANAVAHRTVFRFDPAKIAKSPGAMKYWAKLDQFSALPDDLVIATTEVGFPGALNPKKVIVDLAGLNETSFALRPLSAERLFAEHRPDLIYMPHPHYVEMIHSIEAHPDFKKDYEAFSTKQVGASHFGIALRRDSQNYAAMRAIATR